MKLKVIVMSVLSVGILLMASMDVSARKKRRADNDPEKERFNKKRGQSDKEMKEMHRELREILRMRKELERKVEDFEGKYGWRPRWKDSDEEDDGRNRHMGPPSERRGFKGRGPQNGEGENMDEGNKPGRKKSFWDEDEKDGK